MPFFDCKAASIGSQQRKDSVLSGSFQSPEPPASTAVGSDNLQWQGNPSIDLLEQELWPLDETDKQAAEVVLSSK